MNSEVKAKRNLFLFSTAPSGNFKDGSQFKHPLPSQGRVWEEGSASCRTGNSLMMRYDPSEPQRYCQALSAKTGDNNSHVKNNQERKIFCCFFKPNFDSLLKIILKVEKKRFFSL